MKKPQCYMQQKPNTNIQVREENKFMRFFQVEAKAGKFNNEMVAIIIVEFAR